MLNGERRVVLGTLALTAVNALRLGLQVAVLPVLARLLGPGAFGLVAMAMPLILLATMISDAGLGNALIRKRDSSRELESTIFWISLGLSLGMATIVALIAWPLSRLLTAPGLVPIVLVLTVILPIGGSLSVPNARISREGKFGLFAASDAISSLIGSALAILAALLGAGPWSLVIQQLAIWAVKIVWLFPASGFHPMPVFKASLAAPHLSFGLNAVGASLADFANKNLPTMLIGGLIGVVAAGHYSMAYQIVRVPELIISGPLYLSIFASVARWEDDRLTTVPSVLRGLRGVVTVLAPLFCGLALVAPLAVRVLLGERWEATGPILALLAPAGFFLCTYSFIGAILMGFGRSEQQFRLIVLSGCFLAAGTLLGSRYGGEGVAAGFSAGAALAAPAYLLVFSRQLHIRVGSILRDIAAPLIAMLVMAMAVWFVLWQLPNWHPLPELIVLCVSGFVSFSLSLAAISGRRLYEDLQWLLAPPSKIGAELP